jgi:hypothetical protein
MVAIAVVLVLTGLSLAVLARTLSALQSGRRNQDSTAALAAADAGLVDAQYAMDHLTTNPLPATYPVAPQTGPVGPAGNPTGSFRWHASQVSSDSNTYQVISEGTVNAVTRTVSETLFRWPLSLFADKGVSLDRSAVPPPGITGDVGSNGPVVLSSQVVGGDGQLFFSPSGTCSGCTIPLNQPGPFSPPAATVPPGPYGDCATLTSVTIAPGVYDCTADVTLTGGVAVTPPGSPAVIYMEPGTTLHLQDLNMSPSADPGDLVIHVLSDRPLASVDLGRGVPQFTGVLDAPQVDLTCPAGLTVIKGALTVKSFVCTSGGPFKLTYDPTVGQVLGYPWEVSDHREIPTPPSL